MQAIPSMPVSPQTSGAPSASTAETVTAKGETFSQHLSSASKKNGAFGERSATPLNSEGKETKLIQQAAQKDTDNPIDTIKEITSGETNIVTVALIEPAALEQIPSGGITAARTDASTLEHISSEAIKSTPTIPRDMMAEVQTNAFATLTAPEKNEQIFSLQDTLQAIGTPLQQETPENKTQVKLNALLSRAMPAEPSPKQEANSTTGQNNGRQELTIESWRAQFSYQPSTTAGVQKNEQLITTQEEKNTVMLVRKPAVSLELERVAAPMHGKSGSGVDLPRQPQDANNNFIHSNLPGISAKTDAESNGNTQNQSGESGRNMNRQVMAQSDQAAALQTEDTPLIFSLNQDTTSGLVRPGHETTTSLALHLPSGLTVPHEEIINQVVDRFTFNRRLESGTVTLKLHPAELGELRMELKVEQDNIKAHITTQNPQVQDILDRNLPRLREALAQQGMNLEHMQVTVAADDGGNSQFFQEHFNRQQFQRPSRPASDQVTFSLHEEEEEEDRRLNEEQNLSVLI